MNFIFIYFGILLAYSYFDYRRSYSRSRIQKKNVFSFGILLAYS